MYFLKFFLLAAVLAFATAEVEVDDDGVLVLTEDSFDEAIAKNPILLVEFYAPWCGHCKQLAPEWAKAAKTLKAAASPAKLAKVDATEEKELGEKFKVTGFPTIKYFKNGKPSEYQGGRTESEIVRWLEKKSGPAAKSLVSEDDLLQTQEANEVFVLGIFDSETSTSAKTFLDVAGDDDSLTYAITTSAAVKSKLALSGEAVVILKSFDDLRNDLPLGGELSAAELESFVNANSVPLVQTFSQEGAKKIFSSPIKVHSLFFTKAGSDHHASTIGFFTELAKEYKGKTLFVNVPESESRVLEYFGITEKDLPAYIIADMGGDGQIKKFPVDGKVTVENAKAHLAAYFSGALKPVLKSEEPAPEDTTGPVIVLKGKSFDELVLKNTKDVFVEFYAPWCGHCKKLAPIWDELAEKYKSNSNLVIAKMDSTANEIDVPGLAVQGFPTLFWFKGSDKTNPVKYGGGRELSDLSAYVEEHATKASHEEL